MAKDQKQFLHIHTVSQAHDLLCLEKPEHPLISIIDFTKSGHKIREYDRNIVLNLYCITIKEAPRSSIHYGQSMYDFGEGFMSFFKPGQVISVDYEPDTVTEGFQLFIHPDFIQSFPLSTEIHKYAYFDYAVNEALFLSEKEKQHIRGLMKQIYREYHTNIDAFSQEAIIAYIEVLLVYANRYYNRQFITRKPVSDDLIIRFEQELDLYFNSESSLQNGLPSVQYFADKLALSANYLSDMLRVATGNSAQFHIQAKIVEKAKALLSTSQLSVSEIAYTLGFERPQSLSRLFKKKTNQSPTQFRQSFN